ncbi:MAG: hypothetical protein ABFC63_00940 [Thermoguttaceae bacterium]
MEKAIFSITCTTCRARLVVRSEAAIGAILECPRCESMVRVVPPEGWKPAGAPSDVTPSAEATIGPPPLDRVATDVHALELVPTRGLLSSPSLWVGFATGVAAIAAVVMALAWLRTDSGNSPSVAARAKSPATVATPKSDSSATRPVDQPKPSPPVAGKSASQTPTTQPPRSSNAKAAADAQAGKSPAKAAAPGGKAHDATAPTTELTRTKDVKPVEPDPLPAADESATTKNRRPAEVKRLAPTPVDVAARLEDPLTAIDFKDIRLSDAIEMLAAASTVPVTLNPDAMWQFDVTPQDPITLQLGTTTVGRALAAAAAQRGLAVVTDGGQVLVTWPAEYREALRTVRYTVSDLAGDDKAAMAELAATVAKLVAPESWQQVGGRGRVEVDGGALMVTQTGDVHRQVLVFCERLRNARQKPLRSHDRADRFTLETRTDQARQLIERPVSVNFHNPAPLAAILEFLAGATDSVILVDHAAMAAAETSDRVEASLTVQSRPFGQALAALLEPLGLCYRTVGVNAIQVTTPESLDERLELEFYPIKSWIDRHVSPERLAERLKSRVAPSSWSDVGGQAEIHYDAPSRCLIVLQSQPTQRAIEQLLTSRDKK